MAAAASLSAAVAAAKRSNSSRWLPGQYARRSSTRRGPMCVSFDTMTTGASDMSSPPWAGGRAGSRADLDAGAVRQAGVGDGARRHRHRQTERLVVDVPRRLDSAVRRLELPLGGREPAAGPGLDHEPPVRDRVVVEADPGDVAVEERDHGALAVVVER